MAYTKHNRLRTKAVNVRKSGRSELYCTLELDGLDFCFGVTEDGYIYSIQTLDIIYENSLFEFINIEDSDFWEDYIQLPQDLLLKIAILFLVIKLFKL